MKFVLISFIIIYKKFISPILERIFGGGCRFLPTCSDYAIVAIERHGVWKGSFFSVVRFLRCHPFSGKTLYDPVPLN